MRPTAAPIGGCGLPTDVNREVGHAKAARFVEWRTRIAVVGLALQSPTPTLERRNVYSQFSRRDYGFVLAKDATDMLREPSTDLLSNHSIRVDLFAAEQGRQRELRFDPELLHVGSACHDLGLSKKFSSQHQCFELDGANAARRCLTTHDVAEEQVQTGWEAITLHTTRVVTRYMRSEVARLNAAVGLDALGTGLDQFPRALRDAIVALRTNPAPCTAPCGPVSLNASPPWKARWFETCEGRGEQPNVAAHSLLRGCRLGCLLRRGPQTEATSERVVVVAQLRTRWQLFQPLDVAAIQHHIVRPQRRGELCHDDLHLTPPCLLATALERALADSGVG